jgi:hypothetical protein
VIVRLLFLAFMVGGIFWLVRRHYLSLDFAWLLFFILTVVLGVSLNPWAVEKLAKIFGFGTPSMAIVALIFAALIGLCLVLAVDINTTKKQNALLVRKVASLELAQQGISLRSLNSKQKQL